MQQTAMPEPLDPTRPDPHDPLAPRPDDPRIGRWWWAGPLFRGDPRRSLWLRWPALIVMMMLLVGLTALVYVLMSRPA